MGSNLLPTFGRFKNLTDIFQRSWIFPWSWKFILNILHFLSLVIFLHWRYWGNFPMWRKNVYNKKCNNASSDLASLTKVAASIRQPNEWAGDDITCVGGCWLSTMGYLCLHSLWIYYFSRLLSYSFSINRASNSTNVVWAWTYCDLVQSLSAISNRQAAIDNLPVKIIELSCQVNNNSEVASIQNFWMSPFVTRLVSWTLMLDRSWTNGVTFKLRFVS